MVVIDRFDEVFCLILYILVSVCVDVVGRWIRKCYEFSEVVVVVVWWVCSELDYILGIISVYLFGFDVLE